MKPERKRCKRLADIAREDRGGDRPEGRRGGADWRVHQSGSIPYGPTAPSMGMGLRGRPLGGSPEHVQVGRSGGSLAMSLRRCRSLCRATANSSVAPGPLADLVAYGLQVKRRRPWGAYGRPTRAAGGCRVKSGTGRGAGPQPARGTWEPPSPLGTAGLGRPRRQCSSS